nr:MAG TPA: hypothetical protein [Caudoviricetes sp.]
MFLLIVSLLFICDIKHIITFWRDKIKQSIEIVDILTK